MQTTVEVFSSRVRLYFRCGAKYVAIFCAEGLLLGVFSLSLRWGLNTVFVLTRNECHFFAGPHECFPRIVSVLSVYGVLDSDSWRVPYRAPESTEDFGLGRPSSSKERVNLTAGEYWFYANCLSFVTDFVYKPRRREERRCYEGVGYFLTDLIRNMAPHSAEMSTSDICRFSFPPCLLVSGNQDPLLRSAVVAFDLLESVKSPAGLLEVCATSQFPLSLHRKMILDFVSLQVTARHAFVGVPPCLLSSAIATPEAVRVSDAAILDFFNSNGIVFGEDSELTTAAATVSSRR